MHCQQLHSYGTTNLNGPRFKRTQCRELILLRPPALLVDFQQLPLIHDVLIARLATRTDKISITSSSACQRWQESSGDGATARQTQSNSQWNRSARSTIRSIRAVQRGISNDDNNKCEHRARAAEVTGFPTRCSPKLVLSAQRSLIFRHLQPDSPAAPCAAA